MPRLTKAVKLTGAQVDALLCLNDEALRGALCVSARRLKRLALRKLPQN